MVDAANMIRSSRKLVTEIAMTWGIPTETFLQVHVVLSLIGIASGLVVLYGLVTGNPLPALTAIFLLTTILTGITGFPLPPFGFDPPRIVGILLLILLALAVTALYVFRLAGAWRWVYVVTAVMSLYLNVFVGVTQAFQKLSFLQPLAPTQSEPPFLIVQIILLVIFIGLGAVAAKRFYPAPAGTA
jgi:hypothetical protein